MLRLFAAGAIACIFTACGAQVDDGGTSGSPNAGGSVSSAGGNTSDSIGTAVGGSLSVSTGGSTGIDFNTYCNGMLVSASGAFCTGPIVITNATSCDIPLQQQPPDPASVGVTLNCNIITHVSPDAGVSGFYIDYSQYPAHLELIGSACTFILANATNSVALVGGCHD